jgi:hypothetical protein
LQRTSHSVIKLKENIQFQVSVKHQNMFTKYCTPTDALILSYISLKLFALKHFHCSYMFR